MNLTSAVGQQMQPIVKDFLFSAFEEIVSLNGAAGDTCDVDVDCDTKCCYRNVCFEFSQCRRAKTFKIVLIVFFAILFVALGIVIYLCCRRK